MPSAAASSAARTARSIDSRETPGSEATGSARSVPSRTKIGQIRSAASSRASATISRIQGVRRRRRGRACGKGASGVMAASGLARRVVAAAGAQRRIARQPAFTMRAAPG